MNANKIIFWLIVDVIAGKYYVPLVTFGIKKVPEVLNLGKKHYTLYLVQNLFNLSISSLFGNPSITSYIITLLDITHLPNNMERGYKGKQKAEAILLATFLGISLILWNMPETSFGQRSK